jgi:predicted DNA-binding protein
MGKMVQIRNMPEAMHRRLKSKAAQEGLSLSAFLLRELSVIAERPTLAEMIERMRKLPRVKLSRSSAEIVREGREERMQHLDEVVGRGVRRR